VSGPGFGSPDGLPGIPGTCHGRPTRRLDGAACWVEVLAGGGPRILGFGLAGGPNVLAETPDVTWDAGHGRYELLGGHRLWFAPESPDCSVPDSSGLALAGLPTGSAASGSIPGFRLVGAVEPPTGLRKEIEVRLDAVAAAAVIRHSLRNEGSRTIELSPWPITQLRLGGVAFAALPLPVREHVMKSDQLVVLWPYSSWSDERLSLSEGLLSVAGRPGSPLKVGCLAISGAAAYLREGVLFVKRFDPRVGVAHADLGCNVEIYADQGTIELESLGPLVRLGPGESTVHEERWELHVEDPRAGLEELIERHKLR
jgi:hypothetical protein